MQKTKIWETDSEWFNYKSLDTIVEDLIKNGYNINCIVPLKYDISVQMSTSIKEALIIYTLPFDNR
jgi:hypothetical protein